MTILQKNTFLLAGVIIVCMVAHVLAKSTWSGLSIRVLCQDAHHSVASGGP